MWIKIFGTISLFTTVLRHILRILRKEIIFYIESSWKISTQEIQHYRAVNYKMESCTCRKKVLIAAALSFRWHWLYFRGGHRILTLKALNKNWSRRHFNFWLLSFEEKKAWRFKWILCLAEDSLETSSLIFSEKQWKTIYECRLLQSWLAL